MCKQNTGRSTDSQAYCLVTPIRALIIVFYKNVGLHHVTKIISENLELILELKIELFNQVPNMHASNVRFEKNVTS